MVKYVLTRINENSSAMRIIKDVNILISTKWSQEARKEVTGTKIKNCFKKCGVVRSNEDLMEVMEDELGFEALVRELSRDMSATEYVYFDAYIPTFESMINEHEIDWRERLREDSPMASIITECSVLGVAADLDPPLQMTLSTLTRKFVDLQIKNKKQNSIKAYFT